jgi:hypothetical protein
VVSGILGRTKGREEGDRRDETGGRRQEGCERGEEPVEAEVSGGLVIVGHDAGDRLVPGTWKDARTPQPHHRFEGLSDEVG